MNTPTTLNLAAFKVVCLLADQLIQSIMVQLSLMTKREMRRVVDKLECIHTANLLPYEYLYFAFDNHPEFEHEQYYLDSEETETDTEMQALIKKEKTTSGLMSFSDELLSLIQHYNYAYNFEEVNKRAKALNIRKHYWATNTTVEANVGFGGFIERDIKFAIACHARYDHNNDDSLALLVQNHVSVAFSCCWIGLHFLEGYDLTQPFHDTIPFPPVNRIQGSFRKDTELQWLCYLNLTQSCFKCNTVNCCGAIINGQAQCSHKKGCPFSLWIRRLYSMHEVEVVYDAAKFFMNEDIDDLGDETYECNLRVDTAPFNVNSRGGSLFEGRGTWVGGWCKNGNHH